jgi:predicted esterase
MIFIRLVAIAAAVLALGSAPPDKITKESVTSGGQQRIYCLYVPPGAGGKPMPLLVLLHGSGRRGDSLAEPWRDLAKKQRIVLVAPDSLDAKGWRASVDGPQFLYDVTENVRKTQKIDGRRLYLFGHSAGAVFALNIGLLESRYFAAVAVHAGAYRDPAEFSMLDAVAGKRKIPFAAWVGTIDQVFSISAARATRDRFIAAGLPFQLTEIAWHDHNYYDSADDINKQVWAFLNAHALDADPEFEPYDFRQVAHALRPSATASWPASRTLCASGARFERPGGDSCAS